MKLQRLNTINSIENIIANFLGEAGTSTYNPISDLARFLLKLPANQLDEARFEEYILVLNKLYAAGRLDVQLLGGFIPVAIQRTRWAIIVKFLAANPRLSPKKIRVRSKYSISYEVIRVGRYYQAKINYDNCPTSVNDELSIESVDGESFMRVPHSVDIRLNIERTSTKEVSGWVLDLCFPEEPVELTLSYPGGERRKIRPTLYRADVVRHFEKECGLTGFSYLLSQSLLMPYAAVEIGVGKDGQPLKRIDLGSLAKLAEAAWRSESLANAVFHENNLPSRFEAFYSKLQSNRQEFARRLNLTEKAIKSGQPFFVPEVSICIPVYEGFEETRQCIESVLRSKSRMRKTLYIGFDCSPNQKLKEYLRGLQASNINVYFHERNLGFSGNVNFLVEKTPKISPVLLLNADTVLPDFLVDDLCEVLSRNKWIASATPLGTDATIFTYPSSIEELPRLNEKISAVNTTPYVTVPVAHGFCMMLSRFAWNEVGQFDHMKFPKGYGEEVDWSLRASKLGFEHVCVPSKVVFHHGSISFLSTKAELIRRSAAIINGEYPWYSDYINLYKHFGGLNRVKGEIAKRITQRNDRRKVALFVTHTFGGGTAKSVGANVRRYEERNFKILKLGTSTHGGQLIFCLSGESIPELFFSDSELDPLIDLLRTFKIETVQFHHPGHGDPSRLHTLFEALAAPITVIAHDYYAICPRTKLVNARGDYCRIAEPAECEICVRSKPLESHAQVILARQTDVTEWRNSFRKIYRMAAEVIAPSEAAAKIVEKGMGVKCKAVYHHEDPPFQWRGFSKEPMLSVGIVGAISPEKGMDMLLEIVRIASLKMPGQVRFIVFGYASNNAAFSQFENVIITGAYKNVDELNRYVEKFPVDVTMHLHRWPETFMYTLSETNALGLLPIYTEIGAPADRLRKMDVGIGLPVDRRGADYVAVLEYLHQQKSRRRATLASVTEGSRRLVKSGVSRDKYEIYESV